jgi:hypothetical protein
VGFDPEQQDRESAFGASVMQFAAWSPGRVSISDAVATGNRVVALEALRARLAEEIDLCDSSKELPALVLRLTDVLTQLDSMPSSEQVSAADEIAERRASRRAGRSKDSARTPRSG